jgi:thiol:disulfide interchange protein DsbD
MPHHHRLRGPRMPLAALLCALAIQDPAAAPAGATASAPAPVAWTLMAPAEGPGVAPGGRLDVRARATVEAGWYIYAMTQPPAGPTALRISVPDGQPFGSAGPVTGPTPTRAWDAAFEIESAKHEGTVTFTVPVQADARAPAGGVALRVQVRYQACSDTLCLRPTTAMLSLPVEIRGAGSAGARPGVEVGSASDRKQVNTDRSASGRRRSESAGIRSASGRNQFETRSESSQSRVGVGRNQVGVGRTQVGVRSEMKRSDR